MSMKFLVTVF